MNVSNSVVVLGSTGSIGKATLQICKRFNIPIEAITTNSNIEIFQRQIDEFSPKMVAVTDQESAKKVSHPKIFSGEDGVLNLLDEVNSNLIVNSIVGYAGVHPTIKATREMDKIVALANKESLVVAGAFIDVKKIIPIDSEHFGLKYLLDGNPNRPSRLLITASGGAFRSWDVEKIQTATYQDALKHPNWSMGEKITIDSASMVNKLFELLEAKWLFNIQNIDALIEEKSIVHALVEFVDGSTTAHFAKTDMKLPISYALLGRVDEPILSNVNLLDMGRVGFKKIDLDRYPLWRLKSGLLENPKMGAVLNSANEIAIEKFKSGEYGFGEMCNTILKTYRELNGFVPNSVDEISIIDRDVRRYVQKRFGDRG